MTAGGGLAQRAIAGVVWTSLALGAQAIFQMIALIVLARLLSPSDFGVFAAVLVVIGFSTIFAQLGVGPAIVQRPALEERHLRVGFTVALALSICLASLVWAAAPAIASFFGLPELIHVVRVACFIFVCQGSCAVAEALALRELRFRWLAGIDAIAFAVGFIGVAPALAWLGYGVWALVGANLVQHIFRMVCLLAGEPHPKRPLLEQRAVGELLYFGGGFTIARIGNYLAGQGDNLVVGRCLGPQALGLYAHSHQLMTAPAVLVGQVLDRVLFPAMALVQLEPARLGKAYRSGTATCALIMLPGSVILAIVAPELVLVLLGPAWVGVVLPFQILAFGMMFRSTCKLGDSVARATGAVYRRAWRQAVYALAVVAGAFIGQHWGLGGVALGALAAIALNFFLTTQLSLQLTHLSWSEYAAAYLPGLAMASTLGSVIWALARLLRAHHVTPIPFLLEIGLFAAFAGMALCWCFPALYLGRDGRSLLRTLTTLISERLQRRSVG